MEDLTDTNDREKVVAAYAGLFLSPPLLTDSGHYIGLTGKKKDREALSEERHREEQHSKQQQDMHGRSGGGGR